MVTLIDGSPSRAEDEAASRGGTPPEEDAGDEERCDEGKQEGDGGVDVPSKPSEEEAAGGDAGDKAEPEGDTDGASRSGESREKEESNGHSSTRDKETVDDAKTPEKEEDENSSRTEAVGNAAPPQKKNTASPTEAETEGQTVEGERSPVALTLAGNGDSPAESKEQRISAWMKRKLDDYNSGSLAKKKKGNSQPPSAIPGFFPVTNPMINPQMMNPQMMNPQMMNPQMMQQQMMNWQMMHWGKQMPLQALGNAAAQQQMMPMMGQGAPERRLPPGNFQKVILRLPPADTKLGMMLDDNVAFGLPELKGLAKDSPIRAQIPEGFRGDCCIASLSSPKIGYAEPKTAPQCVELIARSQGKIAEPCTLEVSLVQLTEKKGKSGKKEKKPWMPHETDAPPPKKPGRKPHGEDYEYKFKWRNMLLDFFSCEDSPTLNTFMKEKNLPEDLRRSLRRIVRADVILTQLVDLRHLADRRREAYDILEKKFPDVYAVRDALVDFFTNSKWDTLDGFCREKNFTTKVRNGMAKMIADHDTLKELAKNPGGVEERKEAVEMIRAYFDDDSSQKIRFDATHKRLFLELFTEYTDASVAAFCKEKEIDANTCAAMVRFVDNHIPLSRLLGQRRDCERREEAIIVIERLFENMDRLNSDLFGKEGSQASDATPENEKGSKSAETEKRPNAVATGKRSKKDEFFSPTNVKQIASSLDFNTRPRMSRDGSKEIEIHDKKGLDEYMPLLILNFVNRVARGRILSKADKDEVYNDCAQILFYDHGYKQFSGTSRLARTWLPRLEQAFMSGAETRPLQKRYPGSESYTQKIEKDYPGLIQRLYEDTEAMIGKDAPAREKAMYMNESCMDDPEMPELQLHGMDVHRWVEEQRQKLAEESKSEGDPSITQIETHHPGLIEELYKFALEAMGPDASFHILATCMNEKSKEDVEECPTLPSVVITKFTLASWLRKRGM